MEMLINYPCSSLPHYECSSSNRDRFPFFHFWSSSVLSPNLKMWPALFQGQGVLSVRLFWLSFRGRGFFPRKTTQDQESEGLWHECHKISGLGILKFPSLPKRGNMINCFFMSFITGWVFGAEQSGVRNVWLRGQGESAVVAYHWR